MRNDNCIPWNPVLVVTEWFYVTSPNDDNVHFSPHTFCPHDDKLSPVGFNFTTIRWQTLSPLEIKVDPSVYLFICN